MKKIVESFFKYIDIIKYLFFGVLTTVVNVVTYYLLYEILNYSNIFSTCISWVVAVLFAFLTNKLFVFNSKYWNRNAINEVIKFFSCRIGTGVIELGIMYLFVDVLNFNGTIMKIITNIIVIVLNYVASKVYIFKKN